MKLLTSLLFTAWLSLAVNSSFAATAPVESEQAAAAIAKAAFLKHTKHSILDYSVQPGRHTSTEWHFLVNGEKSFLRPGNHWEVAVNRTTGGTKIIDGL
jgi:hypothetical protein